MKYRAFLRCFLITFIFFSGFSLAADRLGRGDSLRDGETIISAGGRFSLGFFRPDKDFDLRYVGIWYNNVSVEAVVWVANTERPISGDGVLTLGNGGNLLVLSGNVVLIWSSNVTISSNDSTIVLMDTGNLVLQSSINSSIIFWQSFDHPKDTYLPDMRLLMNVNEGERRIFSSWRSASDPAPGNYSMGADPRGSPQIVIWEGMKRRWRSGHWNGLIFLGIPSMRAVLLFGFRLNTEGEGKLYFTYTQSNRSDLIKFVLNRDGIEKTEKWNSELQEWIAIQSHPAHDCEAYNHCGAFAKCNPRESPVCSCMDGFVPIDSVQWNRGNWSAGCVRIKQLQCTQNISSHINEVKRGGFLEVERLKLPDFVDYVGSEDSKACEMKCLENCSCTAYAYDSGLNCMIWNRDLVDVEQFQEDGSTLFVRVDDSVKGDNKQVTKIVIISTVAGMFTLSVLIWLLWRYKSKRHGTFDILDKEKPKIDPTGDISKEFSGSHELGVEGHQGTGNELSIYTFNYVAAMTDNFSYQNMLGEGGFGPVYKGKMPEGQEIAVKRLSRTSGQGLQEFKNEIILIAKLQHINLVRLIGCCIEREEKMLVYEYMPNKSLDLYIFDPANRTQLNWNHRFAIIKGIARGLLYLHRDSRLRIIHRDLKASNILLDEDMNPKISDFGMARIFGGNQNEQNTNRVVGTYGYMAPEYAMEGLFSLKSDVYSFGILLLEIMTGRRNSSFRSTEHSSIVANAWQFWEKGASMDLVDSSISSSCSQDQVLRCIHVGMLCVQDTAANRPNISDVVLMLESENLNLPLPIQPTITSTRDCSDVDQWNEIQDGVSLNNVSITVIAGR